MPTEFVLQSVFDAQKLAWWRKQKQVNEHTMTKELERIFNSGDLIMKIRKATASAIEEMQIFEESRNKIWNKEKSGYRVFHEIGEWNNVEQNVNRLTAAHCANIIRLYCTVLEEEKLPGDAVKSSYRRDFEQFDSSASGRRTEKKVIWGGKKDEDFGGRRRDRGDPKISMSRRKQRYDMTDPGLLGVMVKSLSGKSHKLGGISTTALKNGSTVLKMDRVFGLAAGADISGTTTDTIFFTKSLELVDPIFYLLPVATIVPECHHTLLEVALSLSLNRIVGAGTGVDYSVGLYRTLMPDSPEVIPQFDVAREESRNLLRDFELRDANRLMMIYYKGPGLPGGSFLFDKKKPSDAETWKLMCSADDNLLQAFFAMSFWPTRDEVEGFLAAYS
jgi:hypothetical protein